MCVFLFLFPLASQVLIVAYYPTLNREFLKNNRHLILINVTVIMRSSCRKGIVPSDICYLCYQELSSL